ncbi:MAG: hypothetical protein K2O59_05830 [Lachnospiraceae bacterium]|nr:hypothetical protein [Lachnospiraceae bacterium]
MLSKDFNKKLCLFSIMILLLWGTVSGAASASEITDSVYNRQNSYVNRSVSTITPINKPFPTQDYLCARYSSTQEAVSAARNRGVRSPACTARHITVGFLYSGAFAASFSVLGQLSYQQIPAFFPCGIIITNYIHQKDGRKSQFLFTQP